jgi:hypothetical protein
MVRHRGGVFEVSIPASESAEKQPVEKQSSESGVVSSWESLHDESSAAPPQDEWESTSARRDRKRDRRNHRSEQSPEYDEVVEEAVEEIAAVSIGDDGGAVASTGSNLAADIKLNSKWRVWTHEKQNRDWAIDSYYKLIDFNSAGGFWCVYNNFDKINGIGSRYIFLMRNEIEPVWEHPKNRHGTIWSIQIPIDSASKIWERLSSMIVCETLVPPGLANYVNGASVVLREVTHSRSEQKNSFYLMKIMLSHKIDIVTHIKAAVRDLINVREVSIKEIPPKPEY